ncbi:MAG TPA: choice-of-anchor D domain-containing protein, partial [Terracidiphilus sp.]|nr:choice-of-anchor D domain-containing protein [Terracidiphilus sp.]
MGSPATSQVKLTNSTSSAVVVSALTVSGGTFTVDGLGTLPATVAANSNATLNVHFSPTAAGSASGQLVIANNSLVSPSLTVTLTGSGTAASGTQAGAALTVSATTITFGSVTLSAPATQSITLKSTGTSAVTVSAASITGTGFTVSGATFPLTLNSGQTA